MFLFEVNNVAAQEKLKPFALASVSQEKLADKLPAVREALQANGFSIVGEYAPYEGVHLIVVSNDKLKQAAASHKRAGYVAAQRVALTQRGDDLQVSYTYPPYMAAAYRVDIDVTDVAGGLKKALGFKQLFGPAQGMSVEELGEYHYMFGMEYFDDMMELASYKSHEKAVNTLENNLKAANTGATKVYRIDIPGTEQVLIGVALKKYDKDGVEGNKSMDDSYIMSEIDFKELRSSAHLPYEILVRGKNIEALHARFRIAINFTDLSMMGANSFMNIMSTPDAIQQVLTKVAGGEMEDEY